MPSTPDGVASSISDRVRHVIASNGRSQAAFAASIDLSAPQLCKSLAGFRRWNIEDLIAIADRAGTTVDWVVIGRGEGPTEASNVA